MSRVGHTISHSPLVSPSGLRYAMASAFPFNNTPNEIAAASVHHPATLKTPGSPLLSPKPKPVRQTPKLTEMPGAFNQHHAAVAVLREAAGRPRRSSFAASAFHPPGSPFTAGGLAASPRTPNPQKASRRLSFAEFPVVDRDPQLLQAAAGGVGLGLGLVASGGVETAPKITKSRRDSILERIPTPHPKKEEESGSYFDLKPLTSGENM
ncbi:hypothetical protein FRB90_009020 [Tulasnella sp. 427]|nr:hypothetical protein FRB90_009020 [Tulasnella sp. 427]